ncbi:MAG TPA: FHA domain-containing protein, partial [Phycisphaerales bacterium]|nr:FHA domain-containing protein [Phycisphaerales bacterium]
MAIPLTPTSHFCVFPDTVGLNILLAVAQALDSDYEAAVETLEEFLALMPGEPHAVFFANLYRSALGRHRDVFSSLQRILPDSNLQIASVLLLGRACSELDDPMTARELFRKALEKEGIDPVLRCDLRHALAEALEVEGWTEEARKELSTIHQSYPDFQPLLTRFSITGPGEARTPPPRAAEPATPKVDKNEPETQSKAPDSGPKSIQAENSGPLRLVSSDGKKDILLEVGAITIGREEGDIVLGSDTAASRLHAQVSLDDDGKVFVEDLGSTNGT